MGVHSFNPRGIAKSGPWRVILPGTRAIRVRSRSGRKPGDSPARTDGAQGHNGRIDNLTEGVSALQMEMVRPHPSDPFPSTGTREDTKKSQEDRPEERRVGRGVEGESGPQNTKGTKQILRLLRSQPRRHSGQSFCSHGPTRWHAVEGVPINSRLHSPNAPFVSSVLNWPADDNSVFYLKGAGGGRPDLSAA